jgi:hypothetical protein
MSTPPPDDVYTLNPARLELLRRGGRTQSTDPVTEVEFVDGDRVVFCGQCARPHLLASWDGYAKRCACWRGAQATARFAEFEPAPVPLTISASSRHNSWILPLSIIGTSAAVLGIAVLVNHEARHATPQTIANQTAQSTTAADESPQSISTNLPRSKSPRRLHHPSPVVVHSTAPTVTPTTSSAVVTTIAPVAAPSAARSSVVARASAHVAASATRQQIVAPERVQTSAPIHVDDVIEVKSPSRTPATSVPTATPVATLCATVEFRPTGAPRTRDGVVYETVYADVTFRDGHQERARFPYDWSYPNNGEKNPWSSENLKREMEATLQMPANAADVSAYPALIQFLIKHSDAEGKTDLRAC